MVTIAGADNPLPAPIYMVKLNTKEAVYAGKQDVVLTLEKFPGFKLEIPKNSVTFPDGTREGYISVTAVNASAVPMAPPNGMQPQFIVTIQPTGARFDPPIRLSLPNVDGHAPGAQVEMYSYDHDLEEFVSIGLGSVTEDGSVIRSNPGVGVVKAGWHCGSQPGGSGTGEHCAVCTKCNGTSCVDDPAQADSPKGSQQPEDCKTATCSGSKPDESDAPKFDILYGDCHKPGCDGSTPNLAKEIDDSDFRKDTEATRNGDCKKDGCKDGTVTPENDDSDKPKDDPEGDCKKAGCKNGEAMTENDDSDIKPEQVQDCKECKEGNLEDKCEEWIKNYSISANLPAFGFTYCCKGKMTTIVLPDNFWPQVKAAGDEAIKIQAGCSGAHEQAHANNPLNTCGATNCGSFLATSETDDVAEHCRIWKPQVECFNAAEDDVLCDDKCKNAMQMMRDVYIGELTKHQCPQ